MKEDEEEVDDDDVSPPISQPGDQKTKAQQRKEKRFDVFKRSENDVLARIRRESPERIDLLVEQPTKNWNDAIRGT